VILEDKDRALKLRNAARKKSMEEYSIEMQTKRYKRLYEEVDFGQNTPIPATARVKDTPKELPNRADE